MTLGRPDLEAKLRILLVWGVLMIGWLLVVLAVIAISWWVGTQLSPAVHENCTNNAMAC